MQLEILNNAQKVAAAQNQPSQRGKVTVSLNPVKDRTFIDIDGNEYDSINPRTRKMIKRANQ